MPLNLVRFLIEAQNNLISQRRDDVAKERTTSKDQDKFNELVKRYGPLYEEFEAYLLNGLYEATLIFDSVFDDHKNQLLITRMDLPAWA